MKNDFFIYETELPDGIGFSQFGPVHLLFLTAIIAAIVLIMRIFNRSSKKVQRRMYILTAGISLFLQVAMAVYFGAVGVRLLYALPLHLCSLASYMMFIHVLFEPDWLGQSLFYPFLPGACCALLFPDWTKYPPFSFMSLEGFFIHGAVILYVCMRLSDGAIAVSFKKIWKPAAFLCAWGIPLYFFDHVFFVNYGFLFEASSGSPLFSVQEKFGTAGYLAVYAGIILLFLILFYTAHALLARLYARHKKLTPVLYLLDTGMFSDPETCSRAYDLLPESRREKTDSLKVKESRMLSLGAGLLLCLGLLNYGIDSRKAKISEGENGKPFIEGCPVRFSLSHSGCRAAGIFSGEEVGIDIQKRSAVTQGLIARTCSAKEEKALSLLTEEKRQAAFFRIWTVKESYLKLTGTGFSVDPRTLETDFENGNTPRLTGPGVKDTVRFREYPVEGYSLTVCGFSDHFPAVPETIRKNADGFGPAGSGRASVF